ncbi:MAG TPA: DNA polymerase III subunit chi [Pseudomonadota bacterium]|nr:DNA polymerase III subunit chi [Xanthomonadales bacterium]HQX25833.1 DNA polymerase III subunit chi [Pseudomonadota bacterium]HQY35638.1 DNA polymerase III subunit chi [Pseudomonadota bacterium]
MPRADFYLIQKPRFLDDPLLLVCELALRAFEARQPALILARSEAEAEALDEKLWEFNENAFIPHQIAGDEDDAATAVLIVPPGFDAVPRPLVINLRDEVAADGFERVLEVVPADPAARAGSRLRWKAYAAKGCTLAKHDM